MEEDDLGSLLKYDVQRIKSLELPTLRKLSPLFDKKHEEVSRHLEKLEKDGSRMKQQLSGMEQKKSELEKLFEKRKHIYEKLSARESKAQQELEKMNAMYPVYQYQMNNFLDQAHQLAEKEIDSVPNQNAESNLEGQKQNLEEKLKDKQCEINDFIKKYL